MLYDIRPPYQISLVGHTILSNNKREVQMLVSFMEQEQDAVQTIWIHSPT
jgi:hypothetical protein